MIAYVIKDTTKANAVWVAHPSIGGADHIFYVNSNGGVRKRLYNQNNIGFRPLVCLKSDVQLQKNADGTYTKYYNKENTLLLIFL